MSKKTLSLWPWLLAPILAQEPAPVPDAVTLQQQFNTAQNEWNRSFRAATSAQDKAALLQLSQHRPEAEFLPIFRAGAAANVGKEAAVPYLVWLVSRGDSATSMQAMTTLMKDHVTSDGIGLAVARIGGLKQSYGVDRSRQWLDAVLQHNQDASVLAQAHFTRAAMYVGTRAVATSDELRQLAVTDLQTAQQRLDDAERAKVEELVGQGLPAETARAQAQKLAGNSLSGLIADLLDEAQRLEPGMRAPEIEGVDLDGVAFKLSDYRGKVVMLDFWGDW